MASKSPKRARFDAASAAAAKTAGGIKDAAKQRPSPGPARRRDASASQGDSAAVDTTTALAQLRSELESARKCIEQLRREKDYERRQVRDEEQAKTSVALKEQAARLHAERQRELEEVRETLRIRHETETAKIVKQQEMVVRRLRDDLERCQNELREEVEKRGVSTSVRAGFEAERARLIQKVSDLGAAKRRLEEALQSAVETDKQKAAEIRRLQDASKVEVARVSKDANAEIRKLLEELKAKDHQLALLDRNQYPDKGVGLGKLFQVESGQLTPVKDVDASTLLRQSKPLPPSELQLEQIKNLRAEVDKLTGQLAASDNDRTVLRARLEEMRLELAAKCSQSDDLHIQGACSENEENSDKRHKVPKQGILSTRCQQKAVRFILPGATLPVPARDVDDDTVSVNSEASDVSSVESNTSTMSPDATSFCDDNAEIERSYHLLLTEHLQLQRSVSLLLSSWSPSSPATTTTAVADAGSTQTNEAAITCVKDCHVKVESMKVAIETLKEKLNMCDEIERGLRRQLQEQLEQNEELEFRLFELEECADKCKTGNSGPATSDLIDHNVSLGEQMSALRSKLSKYEELEAEFTAQDDDKEGTNILRDFIVNLRQQRVDLQNQLNAAQSELGVARDQLSRCSCAARKLIELGEPQAAAAAADTELPIIAIDGLTDLDVEEDEQLCAMTCSMTSTTSGFDDVSCASSIAADDTRMDDDEMPSEETWGFEVEEFCCEVMNTAQATSSPVDQLPLIDVADVEENKVEPDSTEQCSTAVPPPDDEQLETEKLWLKQRLEKLERRLVHAMEGEQRARDQLALMSEEKDRRITALEDQVDQLEANEFRLSRTIETLEQLERAFSNHFLNRQQQQQHSFEPVITVADFSHSLDDEELGQQVDMEVSSTREDELNSIDIGHPCDDEECTQCRACRTLRLTIDQLHLAERQHADFDRRIRELQVETPVDERETLLADSDASVEAALQYVDFEAEYREVEVLMRELKKVLVGDEQVHQKIEEASVRNADGSSSSSCTFAQASSGRSSVMSSLSVDARCLAADWTTSPGDDDSFSMPFSPTSSELGSPSLVVLADRNRELEITEQYLQQQISDLEAERRQLREIVHNNETTIRELDIHVVELQGSEDALRQDVARLRAKDDWMNRRIDDLMELVARLEDAVRGHQTTESELRSRLERHQTTEADLGRELENAVEETRATDAKYRRWVSQLEYEKETLIARLEDLLDKNMELESREAALACKIRKMELVETGLRGEIAELERAALRGNGGVEICEEHLLNVDLLTRGIEQSSDSCTDDEMVRLRGLLYCMQQSLQGSKRSNVALEAKLTECVANEELLRASIAEYEQIDRIWQDKVARLETTNAELTDTIQQINSQIKSTEDSDGPQRSCAVQVSQNNDLSTCSPENTQEAMKYSRMDRSTAQEKMTVHDSISAALKGILLLSDIADDVEDTELVYWAAVEGGVAYTGSDVADPVVTSPHWTEVEAHMGINTETLKREIAQVKRSDADKHKTSSAASDAHLPLPPPLPLSPPPTESSLAVDLLADDQLLRSSQSRFADAKSDSSLKDDDVAKVSSVGSVKVTDDEKASRDAPLNRKLIVVSSATRPHSADLFDAQRVKTDNLEGQYRARSEPREEMKDAGARLTSESTSDTSRVVTADHVDNSVVQLRRKDDSSAARDERPRSMPMTSDARKSLNDVRERSHKARQFWNDMSGATTTSSVQGQVPPVPPRPASFRPSLIPRILNRQASEDSGSMSPRSPVDMPVIRPTHTVVGVVDHKRAARTSPYTTVLTSNRSFIPRLVNENGKSTLADDKTPESQIVKSGPTTASQFSYPFVSSVSLRGVRSDAAPTPEQQIIQSATSTASHQQQQHQRAAYVARGPAPTPGRRE